MEEKLYATRYLTIVILLISLLDVTNSFAQYTGPPGGPPGGGSGGGTFQFYRDGGICINSGGSATVTFYVTNPCGTISWTKNGISAGTGNSKTVTFSGDVYMVASSNCSDGQWYGSTSATTQVNDNPSLSDAHLMESTVCSGDVFTVYATASGTNSARFQVTVPDYPGIVKSQTTSPISLTATNFSAGSHIVRVSVTSSSGCSNYSNDATRELTLTIPTKKALGGTLSIVDPIIICNPTGTVNNKEVRVNINNDGSANYGPFTYDWYIGSNREEGSSAAHQQSHTFSSLKVGDVISARLISSYSGPTCLADYGTTNSIPVQQTTDPTPSVAIQIGTNSFCNGQAMSLSSTKVGTAYRWYLDGVRFDPGDTDGQTSLIVRDQPSSTEYNVGKTIRLEVDGIPAPSTNQCTFAPYNLVTTASPPVTIRPEPANLSISRSREPYCPNGSLWWPTQFTASADNVTAISWDISSAGKTIEQIGETYVGVDSQGNPISPGVDPISHKYTSVQGIRFLPGMSGDVIVKATFSGCNDVPYQTTFTIYDQPVASVAPIELPFGTQVGTLSTPYNSNYTYQWLDKSNAVIPGATSNTLQVVESGLYTVNVTENVHGCMNSGGAYARFENSYNLVIENTLLTDKKTDGSPVNVGDIETLVPGQRTKTLNYYDGLGRMMQSVIKQGSPNGKDVVQTVIYDGSGKETIKYLPFVSVENNGWYKLNPVGVNSPQAAFYNDPTSKVAVDPAPYAKTEFDHSPVNRVLKQGAPGSTWQPVTGSGADYSIKKTYDYNKDNEVYNFDYDTSSGSISLSAGTYYVHNTLFANKTIDEQGNAVIEYVDRAGKVICKKVQYKIDTTVTPNKILYTSTYYIYDDIGNLMIVLPPEAVREIDQSNGN